jgi:hypothetical protein
MRIAALVLTGLVLVGGCAKREGPRRNLGELYLDAVERWDLGVPPNRQLAARPPTDSGSTRPVLDDLRR